MKVVNRSSLKTWFIFSLLAVAFIYSGCTVHAPKYSITFVTVREADFRVGPAPLPLKQADRDRIVSFLAKGGDRSINDHVDPGAEYFYSGLLELLSSPGFLYSSKFRKKGEMDKISKPLEQWFHNPIIYQLIDARQEKPSPLNPMCMTDGKYWWIFYMKKEKGKENDFKIVKLLITAAPSKTLKHYAKIDYGNNKRTLDLETFNKWVTSKKKHKEHLETRVAKVKEPDYHKKFLEHLVKAADVYLIARLKDKRLNYPYKKDFRIFIPDMHLLDKEREKTYKYHCNHPDLLTKAAYEFINFKKEVAPHGVKVTLYQLGDFFDLWREIPVYWSEKKSSEELAAHVEKMQEDRLSLFKVLRSPELNTQFILGNHDFDIYNLENFIDCELRYFFPEDPVKNPAAVTLHGDIFSFLEPHMPPEIKNLAVYYFGPLVPEKKIDLGKLRKMIIDSHNKNSYQDYIQQPTPPHLGEFFLIEEDKLLIDAHIGDHFNVKGVGKSSKADLTFVKEAEKFVKSANDNMDWDMRFAVIGHTHHARIAIDERTEEEGGFFALIDCGAWIQEITGKIKGKEIEPPMPSSQIGVLCNNDARIYQLNPKK